MHVIRTKEKQTKKITHARAYMKTEIDRNVKVYATRPVAFSIFNERVSLLTYLMMKQKLWKY